MPHVFLSYIREDHPTIDRLARELKSRDIKVWLDRDKLSPGILWKDAIRDAIANGTFFIACFSAQYSQRPKTFMNEELHLAVEEFRQRPVWKKPWVIPVLLDCCEVPKIPLFGSKTLLDLQFVELYKDWDAGVSKIIAAVGQDSPTKARESERPSEHNPNWVEEWFEKTGGVDSIGG